MPLARAGIFPPNRLGPTGAPLQVNCLTCHQGLNKPLGGQAMIADYPYLRPAGYTAQPRPAAEQGVVQALGQPAAMTGRIDSPAAPPGSAPNQGPVR